MDIKETLKEIDNIGILTKKNANNDAIGASLALFFALRGSGKKACFPSKKIPKEIVEFTKRKNGEQFQITFKEEISEVYYEKKNRGLVLYLTPKDETINNDDFSCKVISGKDFFSLEYDVLFTIGINDFKEVEDLCDADQLFNCTIINIDNSFNNQNYGEVNIIKENESLSQTIACLLENLDEYTNKDANSLLLYGLAFSNKKTNIKKKISTIKWLLENGGDFSFFSEDSDKNKLLEVILRNLIFENNTYVSSVSEDDFSKSNTTSKDLGFIVEKLKNFFNIPSFFILWESRTSPLSVKGLFYSNKRYIVERVSNSFEGLYKEQGGIFLTKENKIIAAKEKILYHLNYGKP